MAINIPKAGHLIPAALLFVCASYISSYLLLGETWGLHSHPDEYCRIFPNYRVTQIYAPMLHIEGLIFTGQPIEGYENDVLQIRAIPNEIDGTTITWLPLRWERR